MAGGWIYSGGKFQPGGIHKVKFAHHGAGSHNSRKLNVDLFVVRLIHGKMATLHELQTVYSLPDAYYLSEVLDLKEEQKYLENKNGR